MEEGGVTNKEKICWYLLWMAPNIYYWGSWSYLHNTSNVFTELGILRTFYRGRVAGRVVHTTYYVHVCSTIIRKRSPMYLARRNQRPLRELRNHFLEAWLLPARSFFSIFFFFQPVGFQGVSLTNFSLMSWKF